ncbi:MAG TPA: pyruvate kinase [Vicinamibacteria bacterium]|nr:pyruvate kinase [Vicinamibacteria bacterium]
MRRTKIVATVGPASRSPEMLQKLLEAGVDVFRLNFSHGTHDEHLQVIQAARQIAARLEGRLALLQDLSGPKIRTGLIKGGEVLLVAGARVAITTDTSVEGTADLIATTYAALPRDVTPGEQILLDDGNLELRVLEVQGERVLCEVVDGGPLRSHKGMNLPGVMLSTPAITAKDRDDLAFGIQAGVDYVALSFVRRAADVLEAKQLIRSLGKDTPVIAKIEKPQALDDLPAILQATDGVMVARGDLGVEIGTEDVPILQKRIIAEANAAGKVVITATQMLESMIENPRPTRAEASDVANAILDGTDAVMLSGESAVGKYPVEAVRTMARIAEYTEEHGLAEIRTRAGERHDGGTGTPITRSLARVATSVAEELGCKLIVAFTESGTTAHLVAGYRSSVPVVAITHDERVFRQLVLWWGVIPTQSASTENTDELLAAGEERLKARGLVKQGDTILMLSGHSIAAAATNMLRVHTVS